MIVGAEILTRLPQPLPLIGGDPAADTNFGGE